ncbi:caffeine-induced death protein 2-domain-containing protein [Cyathus striatus]|nr:caffeine-induced death protein 2-domain-containing protein [Cyathus striatus]
MPSKQPLLGSLALQAPSAATQTVHVEPSTCHNLSFLKVYNILREYRRLDDTIGMRLNRANAAARDQQRDNDDNKGVNVQEQACFQLWRELVENWKRRTQLVEYCVSVVDQSLSEKKVALDAANADSSVQRRLQGEIFAEEVKRKQVHNELSIEAIVRKRSAEAFRSRCQFFSPSPADEDARKVWAAAQR